MGEGSPRMAMRIAREMSVAGLPEGRSDLELAVWSRCRDALRDSAKRCLVEFDGAMRAGGRAVDGNWYSAALSVYTIPAGMELAAEVHDWLVNEVMVLLEEPDPSDAGNLT